jgi:hypothetical protein
MTFWRRTGETVDLGVIFGGPGNRVPPGTTPPTVPGGQGTPAPSGRGGQPDTIPIPCGSRSLRSSSGADVILIVILLIVTQAEADILMTAILRIVIPQTVIRVAGATLMTATLLIVIPMTVIPILHAAAVTTTSA